MMEAPVDDLNSANEDTARSTPSMNDGQRSSSGIDVQKALDILAGRSSCDHHPDGGHEHSHHEGGCHSHQREELRSMGQVIDLAVPSASTATKIDDNAAAAAKSSSSSPEEQEQRRKERLSKMHAELKSMSTKELLQTVLETQQQRVATYKGYNESLNQILQSGNMTSYISSCATATASFAVLSETINGVRTVLLEPSSSSSSSPQQQQQQQQQQSNKELEKLLANLQKHEKNKLNLTAAYHLERIRERNENIGNVHDKADKRISKLLSEGVKSLRENLDSCVEEINETIEEIRYALIDLEEEEEE